MLKKSMVIHSLVGFPSLSGSKKVGRSNNRSHLTAGTGAVKKHLSETKLILA